jgi:hypothetical protein
MLEKRLAIILMMMSLVSALGVGTIAYTLLFDNIKNDRIRTVGSITSAQKQTLLQLFSSQKTRQLNLLKVLGLKCADELSGHETTATQCIHDDLAHHLQTENAPGIELVQTQRDAQNDKTWQVGIKLPLGEIAYKDEQVAFFVHSQTQQPTGYILQQSYRHKNGTRFTLSILYSSKQLQTIFSKRDELGLSGETFLVDPKGFFITQQRYYSSEGQGKRLPGRGHYPRF